MKTDVKTYLRKSIGKELKTNKVAIVIELVVVFEAAIAFIKIVQPWVMGNLFAEQGVIWFANIIMMVLIAFGLWLRGLDYTSFGLKLKSKSFRSSLRTILWSLLVFVVTLFVFAMGFKVASHFVGETTEIDVSGYDYIKQNPGIFIVSLIGVFMVSSFGEEFIYRGFLINRVNELFGKSTVGKILSIVISAVVFGLVHYEWGLVGIVQTFFMGLSLACFYFLLKRRLHILVLAHIYMDMLLWLSIYN